MALERIAIKESACFAYAEGSPACLLVQPVGEHELDRLSEELELIKRFSDKPFAYFAFAVRDWNRELSPWEAPPAFGKEPFGSGAGDTLAFLEKELLPEFKKSRGLAPDIPVIMGGYSLAGLFALWAAYSSEGFASAAGVSPSVWFPGWLELAESRRPFAQSVYLSLGKKEEKTRNKVLSSVGDNIRRQYDLLSSQGVKTFLEWNDGDHFTEPCLRTAKGFAWCLNNV